MSKNIYFSDLFCGAGGISLGFLKTGFQPVLASDFWDKSEINFKLNKQLKKIKFLRADLSEKKKYKINIKITKKY